MSSMPARQRAIFGCLLGLIAIAVTANSRAATLEEETAAKIEQIRSIKAGQTGVTMMTYNQEMDAAWKFYASHKPAILPILRARLKAEISSDQPGDLVLLDVGLFIHENDNAEGKALARDALFRLNPRAGVITENWQELFELAHDAAEDHDSRVLEFIDRNFLTSDQKIFIPQHSLQLDGTLVCVFLYGAYGPDAESHLREKLQTGAISQRVLEVLVWLGSPSSLQQVAATAVVSPSYDTFSRVTAFMMQVGGPAGRDYMLKLDPNALDSQSRVYLEKIHPAIQQVSFDSIRNSMAQLPGDKRLTDDEVQSRLAAMMVNFGKDDRTSPVAFLDSGIGADVLISSLLKVRSLMLCRLSDEALNDVQVTNTLINGLRYRAH